MTALVVDVLEKIMDHHYFCRNSIDMIGGVGRIRNVGVGPKRIWYTCTVLRHRYPGVGSRQD